MALPFTLKKSILRQKKKNYGNSNISPCKNIIFFKKNPLKETKKHPSRYYNSIITKSQVSTQAKNTIFQKPSYKNRTLPTTKARILCLDSL